MARRYRPHNERHAVIEKHSVSRRRWAALIMIYNTRYNNINTTITRNSGYETQVKLANKIEHRNARNSSDGTNPVRSKKRGSIRKHKTNKERELSHCFFNLAQHPLDSSRSVVVAFWVGLRFPLSPAHYVVSLNRLFYPTSPLSSTPSSVGPDSLS